MGASAGGVAALKTLVNQLPPDFPAPVCLVLHMPADAPSLLPGILSRERLRPGHLYLPPPDRHLVGEDGHVEATKGPPENRSRPSVDALFRSAAYSYGPGVIGVVLAGLLDDGSSGLWTIQKRGGLTVVQDPQDAAYDSMPRNALRQVQADHVVPLSDLAALLVRLVQGWDGKDQMNDEEVRRLRTEVEVARDQHAYQRSILELGEVVPITCPGCHGALVQIQEGSLLRFRCHTGHAFTADGLLRPG